MREVLCVNDADAHTYCMLCSQPWLYETGPLMLLIRVFSVAPGAEWSIFFSGRPYKGELPSSH